MIKMKFKKIYNLTKEKNIYIFPGGVRTANYRYPNLGALTTRPFCLLSIC